MAAFHVFHGDHFEKQSSIECINPVIGPVVSLLSSHTWCVSLMWLLAAWTRDFPSALQCVLASAQVCHGLTSCRELGHFQAKGSWSL